MSEESKTVTGAALVSEDLSTGAPVPASDAQGVDASALVTDQPVAADTLQTPQETPKPTAPPAARVPEYDGHWPASSVGDGECQCGKCKSGQKNRDSRGRHHAKCHCPLCNIYRGRTPDLPNQTTAPKTETGGNASTGAPSFADLPGMSGEATAAVPAEVNYDVMAKMYFDLSTGGLVMVFGDEWKPTSEAERENVCVALKAYLAAKGVQDVSPGWLLAFVVLAYSGPRLRRPTTAGKLKLFGNWCKEKVVYPVYRFFKRNRTYSRPQMLEDDPKNQTPKENKQ